MVLFVINLRSAYVLVGTETDNQQLCHSRHRW